MKKLFNYHLYLEHTAADVLRCLFCGEAGDFFTMRMSRCEYEYSPCPLCKSADDSNDCLPDCNARALGLRLSPPGREAPRSTPLPPRLPSFSRRFHPED